MSKRFFEFEQIASFIYCDPSPSRWTSQKSFSKENLTGKKGGCDSTGSEHRILFKRRKKKEQGTCLANNVPNQLQ